MSLDAFASVAAHTRAELGKIVIGQEKVVEHLLLTLVCGGHALIEGAPGLAKTLAARSLARVFGLDFHRVQCTPDLMPADVTGTNVFNLSANQFQLHRGPVFTDVLLVDEINRTPPRTQAALLEAMEERQVTIDGVGYPLSDKFTVLATQNPIEFEGTYPLPEAQLDRFLFKINVPYPDASHEEAILERYGSGFAPWKLEASAINPLAPGLLDSARAEIAQVRVEPGLFQYAAAIVRRTRVHSSVTLGASPRAGAALIYVARGFAAVDAREFLLPDDIKVAAVPVLRHRLILKPEADLEGVTADDILQEILNGVEIPKTPVAS